MKEINIIIKIFFNFILKKINKYKILKIKIRINSPLKSISRPEINEKINIVKKSFFLFNLKKNKKMITGKKFVKILMIFASMHKRL